MFGVHNRNAKLFVAQWSGEPLGVVLAIVHGLNMTCQCPRHSIYQFNCSNSLCEQCRGQALDLENVDPVYTPGCLAQNGVMQAPNVKEVEADIRRQGMGHINPEDVDWIKLQRSPCKFL